MTDDDGYLFDNRASQAGPRFDALAALFDPVTIARLDGLGIGPGWRCWEVGAGGGSVARWLADQVGPTGEVIATDLDVRWLAQDLVAPNVSIRSHDVAGDPPPGEGFDLVHERLVLVHVQDREAAVDRMAAALRPGGWLLLEDFDSTAGDGGFVDGASDMADLGATVAAGVRELLSARGADPTLGGRLPDVLDRAGLIEIGSVATSPRDRTDAVRRLHLANLDQVGAQLIADGVLDADDLARYVARLEAGTLHPSAPTLVSAWGRRAPA